MNFKQLAALLLVGTVALAITVPWSRAQAIASTSSTPLLRNWPPHPESMFHWRDALNTLLSPGQELSVLTVPSDRWFVLNNCYFSGVHSSIVVIERGSSGDVVRVNNQNKSLIYQGTAGPMGFVFAPGTELLIKNTDPGGSHWVEPINLMGYFTRP
jgi:hypothetical protein